MQVIYVINILIDPQSNVLLNTSVKGATHVLFNFALVLGFLRLHFTMLYFLTFCLTFLVALPNFNAITTMMLRKRSIFFLYQAEQKSLIGSDYIL